MTICKNEKKKDSLKYLESKLGNCIPGNGKLHIKHGDSLGGVLEQKQK